MTPPVINQTMRYGDWLFDKELDAKDSMALAEWEREQHAESQVMFGDLLEELSELDAAKQADFMALVACGSSTALHWIHVELSEAKSRIIRRRMAKGE